MRTSTYHVRRWAAAALFAFSPLVYAQETSSASTPILEDTFGTIVIGDIQGLLDKIGALASKVVPGINTSVIKQQAGAMLGDPQLEGLPPGSGIAVVVPKQGMPYAFLEVAPAKIADYEKLLKQRKMGSVEQAEGLLVAAADESGVSAAKAAAAKVKSTVLAGNGAPTLTGAVKLAEVLKQYDPMIQNAISGLAQRLKDAEKATSATANAAPEQMLETGFKFYLAIGKRIDTLQLSLEPGAEAMAMNYDITPIEKPAASSSAGVPTGADMLKLLPGNGAIRGQAQFDMVAMAKTASELIKEVGGDSSAVNSQGMADWFKECAAAFGGSMAMNVMTDATSPLSGAYAVSQKDEAATMKVLREMPEKMDSIGITKLYESMGMPMKMAFQEKVREYKGTPIHQLKLSMDFKNGPTAQQKRMKELMGNVVYDIAVVDKVLLYAVQPEKIEGLIDAVKSGSNPSTKPLISVAKLPPGGSGYFDYNVGAAMVFAASMAAEGSGQGADVVRGIATAVKDAPPLQVGWYNKGDHYRLAVQMPAETLHAFVQAGQQASMSAKKEGAEMESSSESKETSSSKPARSSGPRSSNRTRSRNQ